MRQFTVKYIGFRSPLLATFDAYLLQTSGFGLENLVTDYIELKQN
jgi:hypothetical protein